MRETCYNKFIKSNVEIKTKGLATVEGIAQKPEQSGELNGEPNGELKRELTNRQLQLIAIGGTIGTSLFLGSAKTIAGSGPIIVLAYFLSGVVMFFAMRVLGELLLSNLKFRNFRDVATHYLGHWGGFLVGWSYWMFWIVTGMQDSVAVCVYVEQWFPHVPKWLPGLLVVLFIFILNSLTVKLFGELEFWLSIIKIVAILALIVVGIYLICTGINYSYEFTNQTLGTHSMELNAKVSNLWSEGGFAPLGFWNFLLGFQLAFLAYAGVESIGTAVAETKNVEKVLPKAINAIPLRIGIFYVGAVFVILCVVPWNVIGDLNGSPFVNVFKTVGIASASVVMTFVLITAAVSGANSGLYSTSRMLFSLSTDGHAPSSFARTSKKFVPQNALNFAVIVIAVPVVLTSFLENPMDAFTIFASWATGCYLATWILVLLGYFKYRKNHNDLHENSVFKTPLGKASAGIVLGFFCFIIVIMFFNFTALIGLILTALTIIVLVIIYRLKVQKIEHTVF